MSYLDAGDKNAFADAVWKLVGSQSAELKAVVQAVRGYQQLPNVIQMRSIKETLARWKKLRPDEYRARFGPIEANFGSELKSHEARYVVRTEKNHMHWVQAVSARLEAFKQYAVGDVLQFRGNCAAGGLHDCLARYADFAQADPPPDCLGMRVNAGIGAGDGSWDAGRAERIYNSITYRMPRDIQYAPSADLKKLPKLGPPGPARVRSLGSAICTQFAYAAAHVLTAGRSYEAPRVEVVAWKGGGMMAHCFVIVGREVANQYDVEKTLPQPSEWGDECVVVDAWLAALGHKVAYRVNVSGDYPYLSFLYPVTLVMARRSTRLLDI